MGVVVEQVQDQAEKIVPEANLPQLAEDLENAALTPADACAFPPSVHGLPENIRFLESNPLVDLIGPALVVIDAQTEAPTYVAIGCSAHSHLASWLTANSTGTLVSVVIEPNSLRFAELFAENEIPLDRTLILLVQKIIVDLLAEPRCRTEPRIENAPSFDPRDALTELSPIGLAVFDQDVRYTYVNRALARLNSKAVSEHLGKGFYEIVPWLWPSVAPIFEWIRRTKQAFLHHELFTDGRSTYAESPSHLASYYPVLSVDSEVIGFCVLVAPCRDLFPQRRAGQTSTFRERLPTDPVDELGRFFCHELKEPLRNLRSILTMLGTDETMPCGLDRPKLLEYCERSVNRLVAFVHELSIYTGSGAERSAYTFEDTGTVAREAITNFTACASSPLPQFQVDPLPRIWCCRFELLRVFENLIWNAAKASKQEPMKIRIHSIPDDWMHTFCVEDDGQGISPEVLPYLFYPLSEDARRKRGRVDSDGWGLGLAICRKIIERHGGRIWADSNVKKGSRIVFTLPKMTPGKSSYTDQTWFYVPRPEPMQTGNSDS